MSEAQRSASFMSPGLSVKLPLRKEKDALDERDDRSDRADGGRLPWKDDRADGGRKLMVDVVGVYSRLFCGAYVVVYLVVLCAERALFVGKRLPRVDGCPEVSSTAAGVSLRPFTGRSGQCNASLAALHTARPTSARRVSSRRTHKSAREAPQDSWRFRRAGPQPKGPRRVAAAEGTSHRRD